MVVKSPTEPDIKLNHGVFHVTRKKQIITHEKTEHQRGNQTLRTSK